MARNRYYDDESFRKGIDTKLLFRLLKYCLPYNKRFIACLIIMFTSVALGLISPLALQVLIDSAFPDKNISQTVLFVGIMAVIMIMQQCINLLQSVLLTKLGQIIVFDLRKEIFNHLQDLSFSFFDDLPTGKILVRVTSYIDELAGLLSGNLITVISDFATLIGVLILMLVKNTYVTIISLSMVIPLLVFIVLYRRKLSKLRIPVLNKVSGRNAYLHENIMGVYITQAFNREEENHKEFIKLNNEVKSKYLHQVRWTTALYPVIDICIQSCTAVLYIIGFNLVGSGEMSAGEIQVFITYLSKFWGPVNSLSAIYSQLVSVMGNVDKIFSTIDEKPEIANLPGASELPAVQGNVTFDHVSFGYEPGQLVLDDVSFKVKAGQTVALVGPTGAGKTTIVSLLARFYDPVDGSVLIDGHNIKHVTLSSLRSQVTTMMQDSFVFSGNIIENIRYGKPTATDEECIAAAKSVHADEFIDRLPNGYYTRVEERGNGLSAGERQLLSFARTILADPKIIILDEATSAIDTQTELLVQKALASLLKGRTSFVIAHRLSTIRNADCIMCIANHNIAESGTHEELMAKKGLYYELNLSQFSSLDA